MRPKRAQTDRLLPVLCGQAEISERTTTHPDGVDHRPDNTKNNAGGVAQKQPKGSIDGEHLERQIKDGNNGDVKQKDGTNVPTINTVASTRYQKKHEQAGGQRNDQAINQVIADRQEQQGRDKPGYSDNSPVRREQGVHDTPPWDSSSIAYLRSISRSEAEDPVSPVPWALCHFVLRLTPLSARD